MGQDVNIKSQWKPMDLPPDISKYNYYMGTSGYYFDDWVGLFNPPKVSRKQFFQLSEEDRSNYDRLRFYQKYFPLVEINNTFYREPLLENFIDIERRSRESTRYIVKVHRDISHTRAWDIQSGKELMRKHIAAVAPLIETGRFYSFLVQLEDHLFRSLKKLDYLLEVAFEAVKVRVDVHIEFRHNSWHNKHVLQSLKDNGIGICNTEIPPVKHAFPLKSYATTDKGYIRYSGRNLENWYPKEKAVTAKQRIAARNARYDYLYSDEEIRERVRGQIALSKKVSSVAVAYNNHYQTKAIKNAIQNIKLLEKKLGVEKL